MSSSSCLLLLPRLTATSILPSIFPSITCFRRQFLRKIWPIQLAFLLHIVCKIFISPWTPLTTSIFSTRSVQLTFSSLFQHYISKISRYFRSNFRNVQLLTVNRTAWYCLHKQCPWRCMMPYSKDNNITATTVRTSFVTCNTIKQATVSRFAFFWNMKSYGLAKLPDVSKKYSACVFRILFSKEHFRDSTVPTVKVNSYFT